MGRTLMYTMPFHFNFSAPVFRLEYTLFPFLESGVPTGALRYLVSQVSVTEESLDGTRASKQFGKSHWGRCRVRNS